MCVRSGTWTETLVYFAGFAVAAVPGTLILLSIGKQVTNWALAALFIAEFGVAELMRSVYVYRRIGTRHEPN